MPRRPLTALTAWLATLVGGLTLLVRVANRALMPPSLTEPARWLDWAAGRTPVDTAFAVVRLMALAAGGYLVAITALTLLARASGRVRLLRIAGLLTLPSLRPFLFGLASLSVAASPAMAAA